MCLQAIQPPDMTLAASAMAVDNVAMAIYLAVLWLVPVSNDSVNKDKTAAPLSFATGSAAAAAAATRQPLQRAPQGADALLLADESLRQDTGPQQHVQVPVAALTAEALGPAGAARSTTRSAAAAPSGHARDLYPQQQSHDDQHTAGASDDFDGSGWRSQTNPSSGGSLPIYIRQALALIMACACCFLGDALAVVLGLPGFKLAFMAVIASAVAVAANRLWAWVQPISKEQASSQPGQEDTRSIFSGVRATFPRVCVCAKSGLQCLDIRCLVPGCSSCHSSLPAAQYLRSDAEAVCRMRSAGKVPHGAVLLHHRSCLWIWSRAALGTPPLLRWPPARRPRAGCCSRWQGTALAY